ncbi:hypothetical protein AOQ84DRAFT_616 [Glonium stellatum]|uniref:F-box domain-containing protein n=1 Tax=Glonium stellatum TaxID=574774 RepID=A0A8E2EN15_9PEZI|nr:hypothetical protein AOQ84DRAFT_616 [Glonium stellatum]
MVTATIDALPSEILLYILEYLHDISTNNDFISAFAVCHRWQQLGYPVLWTNVVLTNQNIKTFARSVAEADESICRLVRSLSIQLDPIPPKTPWDGGGGLPLFWGEILPPQGEPLWLSTFLKDMGAEWQTVSRGFWELSKNMKSKLSRVKTCSYQMELEPPIILQKQRHFTNPPQIPASLLGEFLRALPSSCTNLEFDTCAIDSVDEGNEHLCSTIRGIIPRLHHLRLRLKHICPNLIDPSYHFPDSGSYITTKFAAPYLKTMTINLRPLPWYGPILSEHRVHTQTILPHYSTHWSVERDEIKNLALRDLMVKSLVTANKEKALPSIQKLQVINMTGRLKHDYPQDGDESMVLVRDDILANTTTRIPLRMLYFTNRRTFRSGVIYALYADSKDPAPIFGELSALEQKAERETWTTDSHKSRFPSSFESPSFTKHKRFGGNHLDIAAEVAGFAHRHLNVDVSVSALEFFPLELVRRQWRIAQRLETTVCEGLSVSSSEA